MPEWVWAIAVLASIGGFIDFLLGKAGRTRLMACLENWWIRFDDVTRHNFGTKEALYAVSVLDRWFGPRLFSIRRILVCAGIVAAYQSLLTIEAFVVSDGILPTLPMRAPNIFSLTTSFFGLCVSISFNRYIAVITAHLINERVIKNIMVFLTALFVIYVIMIIWSPLTRVLAGTIILISEFIFHHDKINRELFYNDTFFGLLSNANYPNTKLFDGMIEMLNSFWEINTILDPDALRVQNSYINLPLPTILRYRVDHISEALCAYTGYIVRLVLALFFVASYVLRPVIMPPISLIWLRIVESDKPVFTMLFGGLSGAVTAAKEIAKYV